MGEEVGRRKGGREKGNEGSRQKGKQYNKRSYDVQLFPLLPETYVE